MSKTEDIEHLKRARALIASAPRLALGDYAQGPDRQSVPPKSPRAICWCFYGAIAATDPAVPVLETHYDEPPNAPKGSTWGFMDFYKARFEPLMAECLPENVLAQEINGGMPATAWANDRYADKSLMLEWMDCAIAKAEAGL